MYSIKKRYRSGFRAWAAWFLTQILKGIAAALVIIMWAITLAGIIDAFGGAKL